MNTNVKITLASIALIATFGTSTGTVLAAHEGEMMTQEQKMNTFLTDFSAFLKNVQKYIDGNQGGTGMTMTPTTATPAADLRVTLNSLLREHVNLGMSALYNVIDGAEATTASVEALDDNTNELAATIGSVYGDDAQDAFDEIWTAHIGFFASYATGLRTDDEDLRDDAKTDLENYQIDISNFFNGALPAIDKSVVIAGSGEHKDLLIAAMDEYAAGDFAAAYEVQREADKQIAGIANLLAGEIVNQNPELF